jgi:hypothetical protein
MGQGARALALAFDDFFWIDTLQARNRKTA